MSTQVQFRRGTTTQNNAFTGAAGEITYDTDVKTLRLHDGTTAGGGAIVLNNISAQTALNKTFSTGSVWQGNAVALAYGGTGSSLTATAGAVAYSTSSGLALSSAGTSGQILTSGGSGSPTWVNASSVTAGNATSATSASNITGGSAGQLLIQSDTSLTTFITAGASGTFLQSAGAGYAPTWAAGQVTIGSTAVALGATVTSFTGLNILTATGTSHWLLPVGTTAQRPGSPSVGMVRYNTSISGFEGYASGAWSSLGGVKSVDALTYILAETSAGASNGDLDFYAEDAAGTAATQVGQWNRTNLKDYTGTLVGTQTTQNVFNATATTVNAFGAAATLAIGNATSATLTLRPGTVVGSNTTQNLYNTVATTLNIGGAATTLALGAATGTLTLNNATVSLPNATAITTGQTTVALLNTTATTVNAFGAATAISLGAATGTLTINNAEVVVTGNLTVNGTTTTINSTTLTVDDKNIELGSIASPTDTTANGGGITLKGATDKTFNWVNSTTAWTSSENLALATGKNILMNGSTSGTITVTATAIAGTNTLTLPAATDTLVGKATTDTLTNKSINLANNTLTTTSAQLATAISDETGTGVVVFGTAPTISLPVIDNIKMGYTTTATAAGTTTLTASSNYRQFFTGTTTQTVQLPVTSTLTIGTAWEIENNSTGTVTVNSSGGNLVGTIPGGACAHVVCIGTTLTTAADWDWDYISFSIITGTGANVLAVSPSLTTPTLGVATATSVNKVAITAPATSATLTLADGSTLSTAGSVSHAGAFSQTFTATANTSVTLPTTGTLATLAGSETLTNKSMSGASNTFSAIPNSALSNSAVTITAGTGVTAAGSVSLGGSVTISIGQAVGTTSNVTFATIDGSTIRSTGEVIAYYSDDRLKTRTGNIQNALEKVLSLDGFHYHANETAVALGYDASKQEVGLSAQQVQAVLPEVIAPAPIDPQYMTMHYDRLVPLLVEAIKEQQKQIEELKARLG